MIIDDEPFALKLIADYASKIPSLHIAYVGSDVYKAIEVLNTESVELIFLDIQMPQLTGIELMQLLNQKYNYIIISAYPEFALEAYQYQVIDYLLKPITFQRFYQSIEKYNRWQETFQIAHTEDFLFVKADRRHYKIPFDSILYMEGLKDYIRIHTKDENLLVLENMKDMLLKLPQSRFVRIHRSYIIPLDKIKLISGNRIQMTNGDFLPIGETYQHLVSEWIGK
jgi:two-component system LytT family response regulator